MKRRHAMPFGATVLAEGGVSFSLWAPSMTPVVLERQPQGGHAEAPVEHPMLLETDGFHCVTVPEASAGDLYRFRMPDGLRAPDPASRYNPNDVHGASQVIDTGAYEWRDEAWRGRPWSEAVIYELHIGTFTPEGTFTAATARLAALAELGVTTIEVMPLADFPGLRNWGYDGVLQYAPDATYGTPDELKAFVDAAHGFGLMVLIDVVYNHFGPEGNYLHAYCPQFFNPAHQTPWGSAINYDGEASPTVRDFFVHNALYWVEEYHFDGLRMDAIHAIRDDSPQHIIREVTETLRAGPGRTRHIHVVLENELNEASFLERDDDGHPRDGTAQWNDDLHHAAHVLTTGETDGYYGDYADVPVAQFGRALAEGFVYQGQPSPYREGETRGESSMHLPSAAFVSFLQTHDQVGNRAFGERIHALGDEVLLHAAYACVLLSPHAPMLFMGEEYAASTPFQYFCDFGPELAEAVSNGRREEFGRFATFSTDEARARIPDPNAESTFLASKLRWDEREIEPHARWLRFIGDLLAVRQSAVVPHLTGLRGAGTFSCDGDGGILRVVWQLDGGLAAATTLYVLANFGRDSADGIVMPRGHMIYRSDAEPTGDATLRLARGGVLVTLEEPSNV
jgi:maltooligosyltrehalose trehalohydrolase